MMPQLITLREQARRELASLCSAGLNSIEADQRLNAIDALLEAHGAPYQHMARGPSYDCATLILCAFVKAGIVSDMALPHYPIDFNWHSADENYVATMEHFAHKVQRTTPLPADICMFRFGLCVAHSAAVICWPIGIEASAMARRVQLVDIAREPAYMMKNGRSRLAGIWSCWL